MPARYVGGAHFAEKDQDVAMASTSALPSVVTLMRERTVSYMKCHSRGFEKVIWPIVCIAALVCSILLLAVACGTQNWVQV